MGDSELKESCKEVEIKSNNRGKGIGTVCK